MRACVCVCGTRDAGAPVVRARVRGGRGGRARARRHGADGGGGGGARGWAAGGVDVVYATGTARGTDGGE